MGFQTIRGSFVTSLAESGHHPPAIQWGFPGSWGYPHSWMGFENPTEMEDDWG